MVASELKTLYPYYGDCLSVHFAKDPAPRLGHVSNIYPGDTTGLRKYTFNSLGYRGEEFDPQAKRTIFACGGSVTIGVGIMDERVWTRHFKARYAAIHGYDPGEVNLLNFSQAAASNDYIVRTLLSQCSRVKPDLVIAHFGGGEARTEWFDAENYHSLGPWILNTESPAKIREIASGYYTWYTPELGIMNALKNILLLQHYCIAKEIDLLIPTTAYTALLNDPRQSPLCKRLAQMLTADNLYLCRDAVDWVDKVDHPGPLSHRLFAIQLSDLCQIDRLDLTTVLCRTAALQIKEEQELAMLPNGRHFQLTGDLLTLVKGMDGATALSALLRQCFGVETLSEKKTDEFLRALKVLVRYGVLHFRTSLQE